MSKPKKVEFKFDERSLITPEEHARMARELYEQLSRTDHTVNRERFESIVSDHIRRALDESAAAITRATAGVPDAGGALTNGLRPEVLAFAQAMENKLRANDHKGGWKGCDYAWLFGRLLEEVKELEGEVARDGEHILGEAADVANFAMMIADVCGALPAAQRAAPLPDALLPAETIAKLEAFRDEFWEFIGDEDSPYDDAEAGYQLTTGILPRLSDFINTLEPQPPLPEAVVESGNEAFDNLSINVAQMSLSIDYLYDNLNVLSHLCNGLHTRIEKLEAAALAALPPQARGEGETE